MDIIPDKRKLIGLVEQAHQGKLCLPNFQRDFVWPRDQVADLVRSVLRRYFIGSLLLLRSEPHDPPFAPDFLRGAQPIFQKPMPELLVLDGQQRLTALIYALTAPNLNLKDSSQRRWFFVDLDLLRDDPENDEIVFDRSEKELDGLEKPEVQYARHILPCTALLRQSDFYRWRDGFDDWLRDNQPDDHKRFRDEWRDRWTTAISDFQSFEVPLVELPIVKESDPGAIGRVCAIFEKLNSTGVDLSVYDLLTARLYPAGIKLHDLWDEACEKHKRLGEWSKGKPDTNKFGVLLLRAMALMRGLEAKPSTLIELKPANFDRDWRRAAAAVERALELLTLVGEDGFGVFDRKWIPFYGLIPILAALRAQIDDGKLGEQARADLRRWYWCNVFLERYSSAVETKSKKDYTEFINYWQDAGPEPAVFAEARIRLGSASYTIRDAATAGSAVYLGVFCLLALKGARDWRRGENIQLQALQDHHIFPRAYLKRHSISRSGQVNSIVNRTLISDETNGRIKDLAPAAYVAHHDIFPSGPKPSLVKPHFILEEALAAMELAAETASASEAEELYDQFRAAREAAIIEEIRRVCGL